MKKLLITLALAIGLTSCAANDNQSNSEKNDRLIVNYSAGSKGDILSYANKAGMEVVYDLKNMNIVVLSIPEKDVDKEISSLKKLNGVLGVQKDTSDVKPQ